MEPTECLSQFLDDVPTLGLVGNKELVESRRNYVIDDDVQLVCKYLKAYETGGKSGIDKLYREARRGKPEQLVKFSQEPDLEHTECHRLLAQYTPTHMMKNKTLQKLFVSYMRRRCHFLDNLPAYNYNTGGAEMTINQKGKKVANNTRHLGSTLMKAFLREVEEFCDPAGQADWSKKPHQQLIYDEIDGGASIGLISLRSERLLEEERERFAEISIQLPSLLEMRSRQWLDDYLSRALTVPLDQMNRLKIVDDSSYVLTLDYTIKMLNIHERHECGMPVIIEGETGVGKTALVEVLSKLWNSAHLNEWQKSKGSLIDFMHNAIERLIEFAPERKEACLSIISNLSGGDEFTQEDVQLIAELPDTTSSTAQFHTTLLKEMLKLKDNPVLSLLHQPDTESKKSFNYLFRAAEYRNNAKATAELLYAILTTQVKHTFHKLNVHAALSPSDVIAFFKEVSDEAYEIQDAYKKCKDARSRMKVPSVTVFLDEVNTAACLGLFKEIIVDRSFDGTVLPDNVFVIGACNPHRGDSLAALASDNSWVRSHYYVRVLHPTLDMLKWDYGSLDEHQEREYITAKLRLINSEMSDVQLANLTELVVTSQNLMRAYAYNQLRTLNVEEGNAAVCSKSCVSQRDIQRVFTFYEWLMKVYRQYQPYGETEDYHSCAIMVSLAMVYYMRLDGHYRLQFSEAMDKSANKSGRLPFTETLTRELDWYMEQMDIPSGIAKTQALKENIFATIICTMTHTPLIIVGPPGCSKTLSFNLVTANLRGQESKKKLFRDTNIFQSLDSHYYQCSRRTTSNEIQTVFSRAINRQRSYANVPLPIYCVVFMDEAGLPEESLESLKVLHYHLDQREVSFVAISNHMLDAAKTNRAVTLYRSEPSIEELKTLAKGCLCETPDDPPAELQKDIDIIVKFCPVYHKFMESSDFCSFYGLRDFIHFINYLKAHRQKGITEKVVMQALERNFNGHRMFDSICREFLAVMNANLNKVTRRTILDIIKNSLKDRPHVDNKDYEVRYKLIIDSSEDNSLLRLLFAFGILKERDTRTHICSDFPGDNQQQMINTIAAIRHSASAGHVVVMSQTDEIHESFYDLFNQRFRRIDDPKTGPRYYANVAIGAHHKPCRVHPLFQCVVVVKESEVDDIPRPFLNRFEKYALTHKTLLDAVLDKQPAYLKAVVLRAKEKASEFIHHVDGRSSLYGLHDDTLDSLVLSLLPPVGFQEFLETDKRGDDKVPEGERPDVFLLKRLLRSLRRRAGFRIPHFTREELAADADYVMRLVARDSQFAGQLNSLTCEDVLYAVPEALVGLYHSNKGGRTDLSNNACMVISVFLQWLVHHLVKRLMQLMTTEALTKQYRLLPHQYTESYLKHQSHFNLQTLVDKQLQVMELDDFTDRSTTGTANRLLLFTRSSALIHQLPARYPNPGSSQQDYDQMISKLVYPFPEDVCMCKLSSMTSQASINDLLYSFWRSKQQRILLIVANMKETTQETISHLRVMIEENDTGERLKLYILLLHFPPSMFTNDHCYPSLFSNTWDHHYLDIIGQTPTGQLMDINEWFSLCCNYLSSRNNPQTHASINLSALLNEAIPMISSRVFFGKNEDSPFNCPMEVPRRNAALQELFDTGVGQILCDKFLKYWEPTVMLEYLEKAASLTTTIQTSTLSITDSVQTIIRDTFFDFIVYMISKMNEDMNIDILLDPECTDETKKLFLDLLRSYPLPKLSQVKTLSSFANSISSLEASQHTPYVPKFPFYRLVSSAMEKIIEQTRKEINQRLDTLHEFPDPRFSISQMSISSLPKVIEDKSHLVVNMQKAVEYTIKQCLESAKPSPLRVAIEAMLNNPDLFKKYSEAFTHQKLRLGASTMGISFRILRLTFTHLHPEENMLARLALLHICMHVYQLDLSRLVQVLRPLDTLLDMTAVMPDDPFSEAQPSPTASFLTSVKESGDLLGQPGDLSKYVLKILFSALVGSVYGQTGQDEETSAVPNDTILDWCEVYRDVMSMLAVKEYLYKNLTELSETQHNIMHATFLTVQCNETMDDDLLVATTRKIFTDLFEKHFTDGLELKKSPPRLQELIEVMVEEIDGSSVDESLQQPNPQMRRILEGLFAHFFSSYRTSPNSEDCQWFLELINKNVQWSAKDLDVLAARTSEFFKDKSPVLRRSAPSPQGEDGHGCIPLSVYKYYLTNILDKTDVNTQSFTSLNLYKPWVRRMVGAVLSNAQEIKDYKPGPYIPIFYQSSPSINCKVSDQNKLMQQPLAHLYFITVLHNLLTNKYSLAGLVRINDAIRMNLEGENPLSDQIVLHIEQQAVVQVTIQQLAKSLNPSDLTTVYPIVKDLNIILDDEKLGGGAKKGHALVLVYHLLKELRSFSKFAELFGPSSYLKDFNSLTNLNISIEFQEEAYLFPFLSSVGRGNQLKEVYEKVGRAMATVSASNGRKLNPLTSVANEWSQGQITITLPDGQEVQGEKSSIFRMVLWLNAYYKFYCQKKTCQVLVDVLRDQLLYIVQPAPLNRLICCFLDPSLMNKEEPGPEAENYMDPLHALFNSRDDNPSDVSLRHALANMIAVVVAAPPSSTHLWYHMFAADQLHKTHIAGFMLETPVGQDDIFYDAGVQLTQDGLYAQHNYIKHATRGTLTLQSLYLLLWSNVGSFCIGLLTDIDADSKMSGTVFPQYFHLRQFCVSQLRFLWNLLSQGLGISVEERSYLVSRCMWNLLKVCNKKGQINGGYLSNVTQLNNYETTWTETIFTPVWETLQDGFAKHFKLYEQQIFTDIKMLETQYPSFPTENSLSQALLSDQTIGDNISNNHYFLGHFALLRQQLEIGGDLLPNLVEFYQWLHQELSHVVTMNDAETIPLSRAVRVLARSYSPEEGERLHSLFKKMKESYNHYKAVVGHNLPSLEDSTPLLHVLSCSSDGDGSPDLLYTIISMIITTHNTLLTKAESMVRTDSTLARYLPQELSRVHPTEFTDQNCIVQRNMSLHGLTEFEQLICRRSTLPSPSQEVTGSHTSLPGWQPSLINLSQLQEDVFATQLAGKPLIGPPQSLRTHFKFRDAVHHTKENLSAIEGDLETISSKLLDEFKCTMDQPTAKQLEIQFHNASYHTIMETVSGLRGVAGHLIKQLMGISQSELRDLHDLSLSDFLYSVFNTSGPIKSIVTGAKKSIFHEIGIHSLTQNQFKSLEELQLVHLYDCLRWFVMWISQGWYEYCSLPYTMKAHLSTPDKEAMIVLPDRYTRSNGQLLKDVKALVSVINHYEATSTITSHAFKNPQLSIVDLLSRLGGCGDQEELLQLIPETILMENYVAFCVALKQLMDKLHTRLSAESLSAQPQRKSWEDFVDDLWKNNLTHFRSGTYSYAVVMTSDQKKRVYSLRNIDRSDEELLNDLMTAGVSESELLPDTDIEDSSPSSTEPSIASYSPRPPRVRQRRDLEESSISSSISTQRLENTRAVKLAEGLSCEQVCEFLREIGLEQYIGKFEEYGITGDVLYKAGQGKGLEEIGVDNALHRLKISVLFRRRLEGETKVFKRYPVEEVVRFLNMHNMREYVEQFETQGIDGEILLEATDEALVDLGVEKQIHRITIMSRFKNYVTPQYTTL